MCSELCAVFSSPVTSGPGIGGHSTRAPEMLPYFKGPAHDPTSLKYGATRYATGLSIKLYAHTEREQRRFGRSHKLILFTFLVMVLLTFGPLAPPPALLALEVEPPDGPTRVFTC